MAGVQVSRAERVEAAAVAIERNHYASGDDFTPEATAALAASDALLRTDEAVERGARALFAALHPSGVLGWERQALVTKDKYRDRAEIVLSALLGEGE